MKKLRTADPATASASGASGAAAQPYRSSPRDRLARELLVMRIMAPDRLATLQSSFSQDENAVTSAILSNFRYTAGEIAFVACLTISEAHRLTRSALKKIEAERKAFDASHARPVRAREPRPVAPVIIAASAPSPAGTNTTRKPCVVQAKLQVKLRVLQADGRLDAIRPLLKDTERRIVHALTDPAGPLTYAEIAAQVPCNSRRIEEATRRLLQKLQIYESGCEFLKKHRAWKKHGARSLRIRQLVQTRLEGGETLDVIKQNAGLNATECRVLDIYVLPAERISIQNAREQIGRSSPTIHTALRSIAAKLEGKSPRAYLEAKYRRMTYEELAEAVRATGASGRTGLGLRNYSLACVAREQGVSDLLFPGKRTGALRDAFWTAVDREMPSDLLDLSNPWSRLTELERDILLYSVLSVPPGSYVELAQAKGLWPYTVHRAGMTLLQKLKGEPVKETRLKKLKKLVQELGDAAIADLRTRMSPSEIAILDRRLRSDEPMSLKALGKPFSLTRERMRQIQASLHDKLLRYQQTGSS